LPKRATGTANNQLTRQLLVFIFLATEKKQINTVDDINHFGISYMHQLPYKKSIKDFIPQEFNLRKPDLAELLFGHTVKDSDEKVKPLKGRVCFEHAFSDKTIDEKIEPHTRILSSPKATFYPFYLNQSGRKGANLLTYDNAGKIAGRKRYPIKDLLPVEEKPKKNQLSISIKPLPSKTKFTSNIAYHNLLPAELGALLSALNFHKNNDCFHALGMGKPYGYGAVKVSVKGLDETSKNEYLNAFELKMNNWYQKKYGKSKSWQNSTQLNELFAMAKMTTKNENVEKLKYIKDPKNFRTLKNNKEHLPRFTEFLNLK
jgi:CRISPR-associated protein (TIGR03986 family)